ncbi:Uncharacterized protein C32A11.02c [Hypsizygus marmoreus]|uniref:Uncharacterized protein C32A11.02c n=1 Tax=Hypsizygus marmoreus TaxID=39966 RepID=A0A369JLX0_HYPMA|nr:Uncharacterized protein C32A11.02c [Hypsizygus marmoreus]
MDKATSVLGALDAGKLPSTQQMNEFLDWLDKVGITSIEPTSSSHLSSQGRLLANRVRAVLDAYKQLGNNKNADNILQEAMYHLMHGDLEASGIDTDDAMKDINELRASLRSLISIIWSSMTSESGSLLNEFASFTRLSLADAAELIEQTAGTAKENLREIEQGVQKGERTNITGRDRKRVEEERGDVKVQWDHGMDNVKGAGDTVIDATRNVSASVQDKADRTSSRVHEAYLKICDRAQSDSHYRDAINTIISIIEKRTHQTLESSTSGSLSTFINDPTPEKHVSTALDLIQTFLERLSCTPLDPLFSKARSCLDAIAGDARLREWFDDFFEFSRANLIKKGYARSEESKGKREELNTRWNELLEAEDGKWKKAVEQVKVELKKFQDGLARDKDLERLKTAHVLLERDIERGLVEAGSEAETGLEALMERATWFWQDLFRVYLPRVVGFLSDIPIPRTEFKDSEIEFVLENLDISTLNILPSHVYIRNITDVDITTAHSPTSAPHTAIGTLTRIKVDAVQLTLKDVSFWYKDLNASMISPSEFSGLLALTLPPQGISLDIKVRLIPSTIPAHAPDSRASLGHYHIIEHVKVAISEDVNMEVKESNHGVLLAMFKPIFMMRFREALEKTLAGQLRAALEWMDGVAWDVGRRREVFEDTGMMGGSAAVLAAIWSEFGRFRRERESAEGADVEWWATGTGVVVEQRKVEGKGDVKFAMGAEPQILGGEKRGPLGTGAEPLAKRVGEAVSEATGVDMREAVERVGEVDAGRMRGEVGAVAGRVKGQAEGIVKEGKRKVKSFRTAVEMKKEVEERKEGWRSDAFDV